MLITNQLLIRKNIFLLENNWCHITKNFLQNGFIDE